MTFVATLQTQSNKKMADLFTNQIFSGLKKMQDFNLCRFLVSLGDCNQVSLDAFFIDIKKVRHKDNHLVK